MMLKTTDELVELLQILQIQQLSYPHRSIVQSDGKRDSVLENATLLQHLRACWVTCDAIGLGPAPIGPACS